MATERMARTRAPGIQLRAKVCPVVIEQSTPPYRLIELVSMIPSTKTIITSQPTRRR